MYHERARAILRSPLGATEKVVLLAISDHIGDRGDAYPSIPTLANESGLNERTVRRTVRALEEFGILVTERPTGRSAVYRILFEAVAGLPPKPPPTRAQDPGTRAYDPGQAADDPGPVSADPGPVSATRAHDPVTRAYDPPNGIERIRTDLNGAADPALVIPPKPPDLRGVWMDLHAVVAERVLVRREVPITGYRDDLERSIALLTEVCGSFEAAHAALVRVLRWFYEGPDPYWRNRFDQENKGIASILGWVVRPSEILKRHEVALDWQPQARETGAAQPQTWFADSSVDVRRHLENGLGVFIRELHERHGSSQRSIERDLRPRLTGSSWPDFDTLFDLWRSSPHAVD